MKMTKILLASAVLTTIGTMGNVAIATDDNHAMGHSAMSKHSHHSMSHSSASDDIDTIDADDFVEDASAKGVAEIEAGKLALQKSTSGDIKVFAQHLITEHTAANKQLAAIAQRKNLKLSTEAELLNKAKVFILKQREGESFDAAFANHQVMAHKDTIKLFKEASISKDVDLANFATATLPKLEHHLKMAQDLVKTHDKK